MTTPSQPLTDDELREAIKSLGFHDDQGQKLVLRDPDLLKLLGLFQTQAALLEREASLNTLKWFRKFYPKKHPSNTSTSRLSLGELDQEIGRLSQPLSVGEDKDDAI